MAFTTRPTSSSRSCVRCFERKVKCDRLHPCGNCIKLGDECVVPSTPIRRRRQKNRAEQARQHSETYHEDMTPVAAEVSFNPLSLLNCSVTLIDQIKEPGRCWTPTFRHVQTSWKIFAQNVDPFLRILHKPSMYRLIMQTEDQGITFLNEEQIALILSICFASVTSLSNEQCLLAFGHNKAELYRKSKESAELAISRARLIQKPDIRTLQAFTIVLTCCSQIHPQSKWTLTGMAIRIARSLELHLENSKPTETLFQKEMRRRLWWHLRVLDFTTCMVLNCFESAESFLDCDTLFPLNINDSQLDVEDDIPPLEFQGPTEMSFSILRYDVCASMFTMIKQYRITNTILTTEFVEDATRNISLYVEKQYLQLFQRNPATPLFRFCASICQLLPIKIRFLLNNLHNSLTYLDSSTGALPTFSDIRASNFVDSIKLLDFYVQFSHDQDFQAWDWIFGLSKNFHVIDSMLSQLDQRLLNLEDASKPEYWDKSSSQYILLAWKVIGQAFGIPLRSTELSTNFGRLEGKKRDIERKLLHANLHR
ncbi:hypothetical protein BT63DRAFT_165241 [Microthyrium microscopicum]|uniref:Zn(2)-C6 fungal-type domain-containing protein n=1 Tax=Microthyrium microscopicum TaxID=703497 RepID=A0A6A6UPT5_9PEZI|nr:hypothetical protein BT63DRAFT_165241 [Microthyrium microscopicum]